MIDIENIINSASVAGYDKKIYDRIKHNWDKVSKPLDSMGEFEHLIAKIGAIQKTEHPKFEKVVTPVFASDNGIVFEGVSQCGQDVTAICADGIADCKKSVNVMAALNGIEVELFDVGVNATLKSENVFDKKIRMGTRDFLIEPAMTIDETKKALQTGFEIAEKYKNKEYDLICVGEIGIGNTTTSSAIISSVLQLPASSVAGKGAGLSGDGVKRKIQVIDDAINKYNLYDAEAIEILKCVGGYDIASITGLIIGAAYFNIPVILDGFISSAAAIISEKMVTGCKNYMIPSHSSAESAADIVLKSLGLNPVIHANMALGEGTGAVMMVPMLRTAYEVYKNCTSFSDDGIKAYEHLK